MIVISMTNCPARLRGDLSKWLMEINTGVYVGQMNARVRDALWERICEHIDIGQATMVYTTNNEQHMKYKVHNTDWKPVDFDGIWLMKHPDLPQNNIKETDTARPASRASGILKGNRKKEKNQFVDADYVIIDLETTGLNPEKDQIIEVGAIKVIHGQMVEEYHAIVMADRQLPEQIVKMTGITEGLIEKEGIPFSKAMEGLKEFVGEMSILIYNASFDCAFLESQCEKNKIAMLDNYVVDALPFIKRKFKGMKNYKLETVGYSLNIKDIRVHRALDDCHLLYKIISKLNEKSEVAENKV